MKSLPRSLAPAPLCVLLALAGCASGEKSEMAPKAERVRGGHEEFESSAAGSKRKGDTRERPDLATPSKVELPETTSPHGERPRGEGERKTPAKPARFVIPTPAPTPLAEAERPRLGSRVGLAIAFVREGRLVPDAKALLALEEALGGDSELKCVVSLAAPRAKQATLQELAALARKAGHALLLIDRVPVTKAGAKAKLRRVGTLVHTGLKAPCLARTQVKQKRQPTLTPTPSKRPDLVARIARAQRALP